MHEYSVELRIVGKDLNPSLVTAELGLLPSLVRKIGENSGESLAIWGYGRTDGEDTPIYWSSLEDGLNYVLDAIDGVHDKLEQYRTRYEVVLWCGHFQSSFDGGPMLSPTLLKRLGERGIALFIDNYFSDE